jgi:hypothetical protein
MENKPQVINSQALSKTFDLSTLNSVVATKYHQQLKSYAEPEKLAKIKECVRYWIATIGLSTNNFPNEYSLSVIYDLFLGKCDYYSPEEIKMAIICAVEGKFECDLSLYNRTFSADYMLSIIKKFVEYRKTLKDEVIETKNKQLAEKTKPTEEEIAKSNDEYLLNAFQSYKENNWFVSNDTN